MPGWTEDLIRIVEQCAPSCASNLRARDRQLTLPVAQLVLDVNWNNSWNAAASLVTGSHSIKFGYRAGCSSISETRPTSATISSLSIASTTAFPIRSRRTSTGSTSSSRSDFDSFYAQDSGRWVAPRAGRGALRPCVELLPRADDPGPLLPDRQDVSAHDGPRGYHDLSPRGGVAIDLFGNGKTSVKFNFGRYLEAAQNGGFFITNNPTGRLSTTTSAGPGPITNTTTSSTATC